MTPVEYAQKYSLKPIKAAYDLCMTECTFRRLTLTTKNRIKNPSASSCRVAQLLDFIREQGLEPPEPNFFD